MEGLWVGGETQKCCSAYPWRFQAKAALCTLAEFRAKAEAVGCGIPSRTWGLSNTQLWCFQRFLTGLFESKQHLFRQSPVTCSNKSSVKGFWGHHNVLAECWSCRISLCQGASGCRVKSTVRKWLFVVIYLQKDILIQDDVCATMFANQPGYVYCAGTWEKLLCVSLILDYGFCQ